MHGIAETVSEMRQRPGQFGLVGANGGIMSKYSVGVYSTEPADWVPDNGAALCDEVKRLPEVPSPSTPTGQPRLRRIRCDTTGRPGPASSWAASMTTTAGSSPLVALLSDGEPLGASIAVRSTEAGNRATLA